MEKVSKFPKLKGAVVFVHSPSGPGVCVLLRLTPMWVSFVFDIIMIIIITMYICIELYSLQSTFTYIISLDSHSCISWQRQLTLFYRRKLKLRKVKWSGYTATKRQHQKLSRGFLTTDWEKQGDLYPFEDLLMSWNEASLGTERCEHHKTSLWFFRPSRVNLCRRQDSLRGAVWGFVGALPFCPSEAAVSIWSLQLLCEAAG